MASITVSGLGSGLDISGIVSQLVEAERTAAEPRLDYKEATVTAEISAVGLLKSAMSDFQGTLSSLSSARTFAPLTLTSTDIDSVGATASSIARPGQYSIEVDQLAQSHKLASAAFEDTTATIGQGTLTFSFGSFDTDAGTFTSNVDKPSVSVDIGAADGSLQGIRDAVNDADIGITANIVNDGTGNRLVFTSNDSGAENSLKVTVDDNDGDDTNQAGLSRLAYDPEADVDAGRNMTQTVAARDAELTVDGLSITRSSNTVSGVISGVTLDLKNVTESAAILRVEQDVDSARGKIEDFVNAFNVLADSFRELGKYDADTGQAGVMLGDPMLRNLQAQVRRIVSAEIDGTRGDFHSLMDIGIRTQADGRLRVDASKLDAALTSDMESVARLWGAGAVTDDSLIDYVRGGSNTVAGHYPISISQLATQGSYQGVNTGGFPMTIDSSNDNFALRLDGTLSSTISLTHATYDDGDALAEEIAARINNDSFLKSAALSVSVAFDDGHIVINSSRHGSESSVAITSADAGLAGTVGFGTLIGTSTVGLDVAGSIGGIAATGSGRYLTGSGNADGLTVEVTGGVTGARGGISYSTGIAGRLTGLMDAYLSANGLIQDRLDSLDDQQNDIDDARTALDDRVTKLEDRLNAQYNRLDSTLSQLTATGDFLTAQLDALSSFYSKDK